MGRRHAGHQSAHVTTAATQVLDRAGVAYTIHTYDNEVEHNYGSEAAEQLALEPERVFKTLIVKLDNDKLAVGIVPVAGRLNLKALAAACGAKKAALAEHSVAERKSGYVVGGISPFGLKTRLTEVLDASALEFRTIFVSGGRRGVDVEVAPADLLAVTGAAAHPIAAD